MTIDKIYNQSGGDFLVFDGKTRQYSTVTHEEELMNSDFIKLSWNSTEYNPLPVGAYVMYGGVKYRLFEEYQPTQTGEASWKYEPQFQHPTMWLKYVPYLHLQGNVSSWASAEKKSDWTYSGYVGNLVADLLAFMKLWGQNVDSEFYETFFGSGSSAVEYWEAEIDTVLVNTVINITFTATDIWSAMASIAGQLDCEFHFDLVEHKLHVGTVSYRRGEETAAIPLNVGVNVGAPSISRNKEAYCNRYVIHGGTRNMTQQGTDGTNYQATNRLTLPDSFEGSVIDLRSNTAPTGIDSSDWNAIKAGVNEPAITGELDFDDIFPQVKFYLYELQQRLRKRKYENDEVSDVTYATWYTKLAVRNGDSFTGYKLTDYVFAAVSSKSVNSYQQNIAVLNMNFGSQFTGSKIRPGFDEKEYGMYFVTLKINNSNLVAEHVQVAPNTGDGKTRCIFDNSHSAFYQALSVDTTVIFLEGVDSSRAPKENIDTDRIAGVELQASFLPNYESGALPTPLAGRTFSVVTFNHSGTEHDSEDVDAEGHPSQGVEFDDATFRIEFVEENTLIIPQKSDEPLTLKYDTSADPETWKNNIVSLIGIKAPAEAVTAAKTELLNAAVAAIKRKRLNNNTYTLKSYPHNWSEHLPTGTTPLHLGMHVILMNSGGNEFLDTHVRKLVTRLDFPEVQEITVGNEKRKGTIATLKEKVETTVFYGGSSSSTGNGTGNAQTSETANKATRLADNTPRTAWGRQYWENGQPRDVSGTIDDAIDINMSGTLSIDGFEVSKDSDGRLMHDGDIYAMGSVAALGYSAAGGGGSVVLGPLLAELNDEPMPVADGYLHWTGSAFEWVEPGGGGDVPGTVAWNNITGKPATFPPSEHNHDERYYISNGTIHLGSGSITPITSHQSLAAYTPTASYQALNIKVGTTVVGTYAPTQALNFSIAAGSNISVTADATNKKITIANTYSYTHPTNGANTTITAANGLVLSAITVNNLGHVTSVSSKTLVAADIPDLSGTYLPLTIPSAGKTVSVPGIGLLTVKNTASDYPLIRYEGKNGGGLGFIGLGKTNGVIHPYFVTADSNGGYTEGTSEWNIIWHKGNDGSGSGLDADLLDGHDSSYFATTAALTTLAGTVSTQGGRISTLEAYFTNGSANSALKLAGTAGTGPYSAWGQEYWAGGLPKSISGAIQNTGSITPSASGTFNIGTRSNYYNQINGQIICLVDSVTNEDFNIRWWPASRTAEDKAYVALYAWETKMSDLCIGSTNPAYSIYFDSENNRWGVGTDAPQAKLDVRGTGVFSQSVTISMTGTASARFIAANGSGTAELMAGPTNRGVYDRTGDDWLIGTGPISGQNTNPNTFLMRGNVGIGTYAPAQKLHVVGNIMATGAVSCLGTSAEGSEVTGAVYLRDLQDVLITGTPETNYVLTFNGSKWVPQAAQGGDMSQYVTNTQLSTTLASYATQTWANGRFVTALGTSGNYLTYTKNGSTTNLTVPFATNADTVDGKHASDFVPKTGFFINSLQSGSFTPNGIVLPLTYQSGGVYALDLSSTLSGYLPLTAGINNPLTGNIAYGGSMRTYEMITFIDNTKNTSGNGVAIGGGGMTVIGGGESAANMVSGFLLADPDRNYGGSEVMFVANDENVSIFTNATSWANKKEFLFNKDGSLSLPLAAGDRKLWINSVSGVIYNAPTSGGWASSLCARDNAGTTNLGAWGFFGGQSSGTQTLTYLYAGLSWDNTWMVILPNGNLGIGTTSPAAKLDVVGNIGAKHTSGEVLVLDSTASYTCAQYKVGGTAKWSVGANSSSFYFYSNNGSTIRMSILESGNVGIGTSQPGQKLHVNGNIAGDSLWLPVAGSVYINDKNMLTYNSSQMLSLGYGMRNDTGTKTDIYGKQVEIKEQKLKIGDCIIEWDSTHGMLKFSNGIYSMGAVSALGVAGDINGVVTKPMTFAADVTISNKLCFGNANYYIFKDASNRVHTKGNAYFENNVAVAGEVAADTLDVSGQSAFSDDMMIDGKIIFGTGEDDDCIYVSNNHLYFKPAGGSAQLIK